MATVGGNHRLKHQQADPQAKVVLGTSDSYMLDNILRLFGKDTTRQAFIRNGKFITQHQTFASIKDFKAKDIEIKVDADSSAETGIFLRAKHEFSFLLARYSPEEKELSFREKTGGYWNNKLAVVKVDELDKNPIGKPFEEVYDIDKVEPTPEWQGTYDEVREELIKMGLPLDRLV